MNIDIVIGANYGDEGKGLFTEFLSKSSDNSIVVLANGGSQRGHTVNDPIYGKHVFHHFGAGTLARVPTYFAKSYLLNPMQFVKEKDELEALISSKKIATNSLNSFTILPDMNVVSYRDHNCFVQLPIDIALNWHIEKCRGEKRHGSVGCGIWESTYRVKYSNDDFLKLKLSDIVNWSYNDQIRMLKDYSYSYAIQRCKDEGVSTKIDLLDIFLSDGFIEHYIADANRMYNECKEMSFDCLNTFDNVIFENGQGLMLDQYYNITDIDNTTPSYTGSIGIANLLQSFKYDVHSVKLNYITRTYLTKHGAGKFDAECAGMKFEDSTNIYNEWQEGLRFGELDYSELLKRIDLDFNYFKQFYTKCPNVLKNIVFTHCNEVEMKAVFSEDANIAQTFVSFTDLAKDIRSANRF